MADHDDNDELNLDDGAPGGAAVDSNLSDDDALFDEDGNQIDEDGNIVYTREELEEAEAQARGDVVDGGEEGEDDEGGEVDTDALAEVAGSAGATVPRERFNQVWAENQKMQQALSALPEVLREITGAQRQAAAAPAAQQEKQFDFSAAIRARNKAILEGDEDEAAKLDEQILTENRKIVAAQANAEADARATARIMQRDTETVIAAAFEAYPFLNDADPALHNKEALDDVMMYRDRYIKQGHDLPTALQMAVDKVGPMYADEAEAEAASAGKGGKGAAADKKPVSKVAQIAAARRRQQILRNGKAAASQPPSIARAGISSRGVKDYSGVDPASIPEEEYERLPESVKKKMRGD